LHKLPAHAAPQERWAKLPRATHSESLPTRCRATLLPKIAESPVPRYRALILSPHYDDAVFSCGGMIAQEGETGKVHILNVFTHFPESVRSGSIILSDVRREEDDAAIALLGATSESLGATDAFLRRPAYRSPANLFRKPVPEDMSWLRELSATVAKHVDALDYEVLYAPLGIGWHVDHVLCHLVARGRLERDKVCFYEDAPYCLLPHAASARLHELTGEPSQAPAPGAWREMARTLAGWAPIRDLRPFPVRWAGAVVVGLYLKQLLSMHRPRAEASLPLLRVEPVLRDVTPVFGRKLEACYAYRTQVRAFFTDEASCEQNYRSYAKRAGGNRLVERFWRPVGAA